MELPNKKDIIPTYDPKVDVTEEQQRAIVRELGARLEQTIIEYARFKGSDIKTGLVSLALKYVLDLITRRKNVASAYYLKAKELADLAYDKVIEPFSDDDVKEKLTPTDGEVKEFLRPK